MHEPPETSTCFLRKRDIDEALAELKHLAAIDLEDFVTFEFVG